MDFQYLTKFTITMEKLTAQQAVELAKENEPKIELILKTIEEQCKYGYRFIMQVNLSASVMNELLELGYTVSRFTDSMGVEQTKIKW